MPSDSKRDELMNKQIKEAERREASERRWLVEDVDVLFNLYEAGDVLNKSRRPITDITCKVMSRAGRRSLVTPDGCAEVARLQDGKGLTLGIEPVSRFETLRPGARCSFHFEGHEPEPDHVLVVWFTDDAGFRWQLDQYLHLVQSGDEDQYVP
jgi:hypothetical protein